MGSVLSEVTLFGFFTIAHRCLLLVHRCLFWSTDHLVTGLLDQSTVTEWSGPFTYGHVSTIQLPGMSINWMPTVLKNKDHFSVSVSLYALLNILFHPKSSEYFYCTFWSLMIFKHLTVGCTKSEWFCRTEKLEVTLIAN